MISATRIDRVWQACPAIWLLAAAAILVPALCSAGSGSATLTVGVTVVRSCSVDARPVDRSTTSLNLRCTAGAARSVRVGNAIRTPAPGVVSTYQTTSAAGVVALDF